MEFVYVIHKFHPSVGGAQLYFKRLATHAVKMGAKVTVLTSTADTRASCETWNGIEIRRFGRLPRLTVPSHTMPGMIPQALTERVRRAEIVHTWGYMFFTTLFGMLAKKLWGGKLVVTPCYSLFPKSSRRRAYDRHVAPRVIRSADLMIVQSEKERAQMREGGTNPGERLSIIPFGIDSEAFRGDGDPSLARRTFGIPMERPLLLFVGRVISGKGSFQMLDALAMAKREVPDILLAVVGGIVGNEEKRFRETIENKNLAGNLLLTGVVRDERLKASLYAAARAVLFPSQHEQFGIVALEAAASGKPLLGTPVGVIPEIVAGGRYGLLHEFDEHEKLAANILTVLRDDRFEREARGRRADILARYGWDSIATRHWEEYMKLLGRKADSI